jgi:hypothetical protein
MYLLGYPKDSVLWKPVLPVAARYLHHHAPFIATPGAVDVVEERGLRAFLPHAPDHGAKVTFLAGNPLATGFVVVQRGARINKLDEDMTADIDGFLFSLVWEGRIHGWRLDA